MGEDKLPRPAKGFLVKAELRMTPDKGIGVFTTQFIPANTLVYMSDPLLYSEEEATVYLESLPTLEERQDWISHSYGSQGKICIDRDDIIRINHSDNPTLYCKSFLCTSSNSYSAIAARDVKEGEELTEDYRTYTLTPAYVRLCKKYGVCEVYEMEEYSK